MSADTPFKPIYPDVLGMVTNNIRVNLDSLECALGVFPQQVYLNQPFEIVLVLQNMVDQPLIVKVALRLPSKDRNGKQAVIDTPKSQIGRTLEPGEVGVVRFPVVVHTPTQPGKGYPARVAVRFRPQGKETPKPLRPPGGGVAPTVLSVSPFKAMALQEVTYNVHKWNESAEIMTVYFDIAPRRLPDTHSELNVRYETLWRREQMQKDIELVEIYYDDVLALADSTAYPSSYVWFYDAVEERFAARGLPLHPGEIRAITKMMTYTVDDAHRREPDVHLSQTRWFRALAQAVARDPDLLEMERGELLAKHVFEAVLYESVLIAFPILESRVKEDLGSKDERYNYANRLMTWFSGHGEADLSYAYLPLVLTGLIQNRTVRHSVTENPWDMYDELTEAAQGRKRLVAGAQTAIFTMLDALLDNYSRTLTLQRVERPRTNLE